MLTRALGAKRPRRAAIREMKALRNSCLARLSGAAPPLEQKHTLDYNNWETSLEFVGDAYIEQDHDLLKIYDAYLSAEIVYLRDIVFTLREAGHQDVSPVLNGKFVAEALSLTVALHGDTHEDAHQSVNSLSIEETQGLARKAVSLLFQHPGTRESLQYLIMVRGIVAHEILEDMLMQTLDVPDALLDGAL